MWRFYCVVVRNLYVTPNALAGVKTIAGFTKLLFKWRTSIRISFFAESWQNRTTISRNTRHYFHLAYLPFSTFQSLNHFEGSTSSRFYRIIEPYKPSLGKPWTRERYIRLDNYQLKSWVHYNNNKYNLIGYEIRLEIYQFTNQYFWVKVRTVLFSTSKSV